MFRFKVHHYQMFRSAASLTYSCEVKFHQTNAASIIEYYSGWQP